MKIVVAIHGILTGNTPRTWPEQFAAWLQKRESETQVLCEKYFEGPFPRWNSIKNRWLAWRLARQIEGLVGGMKLPPKGGTPNVWFVAHSNGACIALLTAKLLIARGQRIGGLILTGAACEADVAKNGVLEWWSAGMLGRAVAYCSEDDEVLDGDAGHGAPNGRRPLLARVRAWLWGELIWPYGCLGRTGWVMERVERKGERWRIQSNARPHPSPLPQGEGEQGTRAGRMEALCAFGRLLGATKERTPLPGPLPFARGEGEAPLAKFKVANSKIVTRWFRGGHSTYFTAENIEKTFELMREDMREQDYGTTGLRD